MNPDSIANINVQFLPVTREHELPAIRVDDAQVTVYWEDGGLRVTVDTSDVAPADTRSGVHGCALTVDVENGTVFTRDLDGTMTYGDDLFSGLDQILAALDVDPRWQSWSYQERAAEIARQLGGSA